MRRRRFTLTLLVLIAGAAGLASLPTHASSQANRDCALAEAFIEPGDLVLIDVPSIVFRRVAQTSGGIYSHIGVAFRDEDGNWQVAESHIPVSTFTPLCKYLAGTDQNRFALRRLKRPLSSEELTRMRKVAQSLMGIVYDTGFNFNSRKQFCSKFAYEVYARGAGVRIGYFQTFRELLGGLEGRPDRDKILKFWNRWFLGSIPWERVTITPQSEMDDAAFDTILDTAL